MGTSGDLTVKDKLTKILSIYIDSLHQHIALEKVLLTHVFVCGIEQVYGVSQTLGRPCCMF